MTRAFMIEFEYEGRSEFANVVEYKHSPSVFHVSTVSQNYRPVRKLTLRQQDNQIVATEHSMLVTEGLIKIISEKIRDYTLLNPRSV